jgi:Zn-dependent peptidase ImmA (M78 family)
MDQATRKEIQRITAETLRDAGLTEPPLSVERLLEHLRLYRDYYDLSDPGFLDRAKHKLRVHGQKLVEIINKVRLKAVLLFDESRICIDNSLPKIKQPWASCHETGHRILPWHKPFFFGDTAESLDPAYQDDLEDEANYAAGRLLFLGERFSDDARDVPPTIDGVKQLARLYRASLTTTLRRYVEQGPDIAMAMLVSTPSWSEQPEDQQNRWRHFVPSPHFRQLFPELPVNPILALVDSHVHYRRGGTVGEFRFGLVDARGERHEMGAWSFNNQYYLLTLVVEEQRVTHATIATPFSKVTVANRQKVRRS